MKQKVKFSLGKKLTAMIVFLSVALSLVAILVSYRIFSSTMTRYYKELGTNLVRTLASQLDADELDYYYETGEMDENYYKTQQFIQDLVASNNVEYLYVVRPNGVGVTFLFDSDMEVGEGGEYYDGGYCALGTYVDLVGGFAENLDKLLAGEDVEPIIQPDAGFGWLMTAMVPVLHEDGTMAGYVMADISMYDVMHTSQTFLITLVVLLVALTVAFIVLFLTILRRKVIQPIDQLTQATGAFIQNNEDELAAGTATVNVPEIRTGDEVEELANSFRKMEEDMISYIRSFMKITAEKERIGAELNVATQIQADMLPRIFPAFPERQEFDIYATMNPAKEVGGDFYDFFLVDDDHLAVVIADVSGKGVPAALFMVIAKTLIKNHAQNKEAPGEVFTNTNEQLCEGNDAGLFVTAWMGVLQISTGHFVYVNAGHNPPLLRRAGGSFEWLKSRPGFVLAGMEGVRYRENEMELAPGDVLYLYTDGVTEATDAHQQLFGEERLQTALNEQPMLPVGQMLSKIKGCIDSFVGEAEQFDDITMLGLEYLKRGDGTDG
ncbi:PP2C family protein-serine/threonine phosphatase [Pseudoflavonifractor phocaeensis]|uniref:PP2C family protein-serine/threonine phosphatase n=1 Tax=Pseudoflavonifractor phocaeensis TaxID=1870988 RepID=UPI00195B11DC|nr:SpoIIE family protein phosphatase [Pseudoflavonifractor phocaeensis]MBM6884975.1 SpoIIE family protein phosphatase [Pseudoflavonifractor phocaeensis]